ncbi:MAG: DUF1569 domain-containing protein [Sphingobacteriales bacterium]|nr:MAG: DUF1569 domain-containing protein [Sphingobacteriales bacterium]
MLNLFETKVHGEVLERMNKLSHHSERKWGKMEVGQMLAHCKEAFRVPLSEKPMKRNILGLLIGWAVKSQLYSDKPWRQNMPTAPNFVIKDKRNFDNEKEGLLELINLFHSKGPGKVGVYPHPMFGRFTSEQWGQAMYKHLDHHLRQFGV